MKNIITALLVILSTLTSQAQKVKGKPFGFAVCTSMTDATPYNLNGGGKGRTVTLVSDGNDMRQRIIDAIAAYDVIIFDGKGGDFIVSRTMRLNELENKTLLGINGARLCTKTFWTKELHSHLDRAGVMSASSIGNGTTYTLSNGNKVREEREWRVRQEMINFFNDSTETFRDCGLFNISRSQNIIIQNLHLIGPGAVDISGADLLNLSRCEHVWVDHCEFVDGVDGNFDINTFSDLITVSYCHFHYTERTFDHANTNLVGSNDNAKSNGEDALNITFAYNHWGKGCNQRMPMARFGTIHVLNNYYDCAGNHGAINPRRGCEMLIEGNYFDHGVKRIFSASDDAKAFVFCDNYYAEPFRQPTDRGTVTVPYKYKRLPVHKVASMVKGPKD